MKLIHLSDLHLGKRLYGFSLMEDQRYILEQILKIVEKEKPDGVILAGDLYDKSIPPAEAVRLFDWFLTRLSDLNQTVAVISGNHDSAERLAFGADLMSSSKVYVSPVYDGEIKKVVLTDQYGQADLWLLPFMKPVTVRQALKDEKIEGYENAVKTVIGRMEIDTERRNILVAHQFVTGASLCESEEINVGGLDQISTKVFDDFDYVALGHIHSPQAAGRDTVRYCGTPLKYSFSEAGQTKSVTVAELFEKGRIKIRTIPLSPLREMRKIRGTYMELMSPAFYQKGNREDYVHVTLTDEEDIPDGLQKLRVVYPNLMQLVYDNLRTQKEQELYVEDEPEQKSEKELFEDFYQKQNNQEMAEEQRKYVEELLERLLE
ncbi:MAG: exonuclease SbcCD subunit D [Lachnospiraceae bacterium]|nr:exonuclease SbcCD subunit D [Lachnospiraceae bacterium]